MRYICLDNISGYEQKIQNEDQGRWDFPVSKGRYWEPGIWNKNEKWRQSQLHTACGKIGIQEIPIFQKSFQDDRRKGISLQMMSVGSTFTIDFQQNFPDDTYAKTFLAEASKMGLTAHCSNVIAYTTPKDHTANTNFIKSLAGFFSRRIKPLTGLPGLWGT